MRWAILLVTLVAACTSPKGQTRNGPSAPRTAARQTTAPSGWWDNNPYVTKKDGKFIVGTLRITRGDFASLIGMPTPHPEKALTVPMVKEILRRIHGWLSDHSGETLCEAVVTLRSTCNEAVDAVFQRLPKIQPLRKGLDFYSGNHSVDMVRCGKQSIFHPLVLCTVDWKRTYDSKDTCLAYAYCVAGYTRLVTAVQRASNKQGQPAAGGQGQPAAGGQGQPAPGNAGPGPQPATSTPKQ